MSIPYKYQFGNKLELKVSTLPPDNEDVLCATVRSKSETKTYSKRRKIQTNTERALLAIHVEDVCLLYVTQQGKLMIRGSVGGFVEMSARNVMLPHVRVATKRADFNKDLV